MKYIALLRSEAIHGPKLRLASVVSKAKSARIFTNSRNLCSMMRPALMATFSGSKADSL